MPNFRTPIALQASPFFLSHQDHILCIGSCFAQNIAQRLQALKYSTLLNPFGILYNPHSICKVLELLLSEQQYQQEDLFLHQDLWHSFDHHGSFSGTDAAITLQQINAQLQQARDFLKTTNRILITLGTAQVFEHIKSNQIVGNCHKLPNSEFHRKRLSITEIQQRLTPILKQLKERKPDLEIILSLSPIRHIRDGHIENQRSKASLILAIDQLEKAFAFIHYFPAYEILLDDLRDYRFYAADLVHPSPIAIDYIWGYFSEKYFSVDHRDLNKRIEAILQAANHRALHPTTTSHQNFIQQQLAKIEKLTNEFAFLDFSKEIYILQQQLS